MNTIKKGSKGEDVKTLQDILQLKIDGIFGEITEKAVKTFQTSKGLTPDGIVGPKTWEALFSLSKITTIDRSIVYSPLKVHITKSPNRTIKYLAIHYTAGSTSKEGSARNIKKVFEKRNASADFAVDDKDIVQFNPDLSNYYCWAVGDTKSSNATILDGRNSNTISIEICSTLEKGSSSSVPNHTGWSFTNAALDNAVKLTKILMKKYNIPLKNVVRHYDITGKLCPGIVGWNDGKLYTKTGELTKENNNSETWKTFKNKLL